MYNKAIECDPYLAIAHFQLGVSNFLMGGFEAALTNFNDALDVPPVVGQGLPTSIFEAAFILIILPPALNFQLYSCEILFNRGWCYLYLDNERQGIEDLQNAMKQRRTVEHSKYLEVALPPRTLGLYLDREGDCSITEMLQHFMVQGIKPFRVPNGVFFRPSNDTDYLTFFGAGARNVSLLSQGN